MRRPLVDIVSGVYHVEMAKQKALVRIVRWDGAIWRRYPKAKQRNRRVYYSGYWRRMLTTLHRAVWEKEHGPIPDGREIHHIDGNPLNNTLENLECLTPAEHRRKESEAGSFSTPNIRRNLNRIRPLAATWHRSLAGRAWHQENGRRVMAARPFVSKTCEHCRRSFQAKNQRAKVCSQSCADKIRPPRTAIHRLTCGWCGCRFNAKRKTQQFCSYSCSGKWRHSR